MWEGKTPSTIATFFVEEIIKDIGCDCAISAGGAIRGHSMGAIAGAKALRQAIDAVVSGVSLKDHASSHEELKAALEKWQ